MRYMALVFVALAASGCGVDPPATSPTPLPARGTPAKIELSATPGVGPNGGTATVTARILDAYATLLPDVDVTFSADAGNFDAASVKTNDKGIAATVLKADPGQVKVHATAGGVQAPETAVAIQPVNIPQIPPGPIPPPEIPVPPIPPPSPSYGVLLTATPASAVVGAPVTLAATVTPFNGAPAVTAWAWDCDRTITSTDATTPNSATCTYATPGTFTAIVSVTGGTTTGIAITTVTVTAVPPPPSYTVSVTAAPASIALGSVTTLTATVTANNGAPPVTAWAWDCDTNAPTVDAVTPNATTCGGYATTGTYTTKVTVTGGTVTGSATTLVTVTPAPLSVSIDPVSPTLNIAATITARVTSLGPVPINALTWEWDFESSPTSTFTVTESGVNAHSTTFTYSTTGTKTIKVRVTDPLTGRTAIGQRSVIVP